MIQEESLLVVADNTGAKIVQCIRVLKGSKGRYAGPGDTIVCSVKQALPQGNVRKKTVVKAVIVRTSYPMGRPDGTYVRSDDNACVIVDDKGEPKGTRVFGPIFREVKALGFQKIASLAPEVL